MNICEFHVRIPEEILQQVVFDHSLESAGILYILHIFLNSHAYRLSQDVPTADVNCYESISRFGSILIPRSCMSATTEPITEFIFSFSLETQLVIHIQFLAVSTSSVTSHK